MLKQSLLFAFLLIVALVAFGCKSSKQQAKRPTPPKPAATTSCSGACSTGETETIDVALKLPEGWKQTFAPPPDNGQSEGCPSSQMQKILGVTFSSNEGCVIGTMDLNGIAAKSGLQVGDSIKNCNGGEVDCPSSLNPLFWITKGNEAKLVISRVKCSACNVGEAAPPPTPAKGETK